MLLIKKIGILAILGYSTLSSANILVDYEKLNETASCDSTCSVNPDKVSTLSSQNQRLSNCGYGYVGNQLEDRILQEDGNWSNWRAVNRDNCTCSPLTENQEIACPTNQRGQHIQTRDWTCPSVEQGAYTDWVTKSNTCDYYYLSTDTEEQTIACPENQRGKHIQERSYETWSDNNRRNQSAWKTKSNTCDYYLIAASQTEIGSATCPTGYTGSITQTRTYDLYSDGYGRNYSGWTQVSNNCVSASPISSVNVIYPNYYELHSFNSWTEVHFTFKNGQTINSVISLTPIPTGNLRVFIRGKNYISIESAMDDYNFDLTLTIKLSDGTVFDQKVNVQIWHVW